MTVDLPASESARRLVIAYAFAPFADTSAIAAAKRVRERGERVDLIQNAMGEIRDRDHTADAIAERLIHRRSILPTPTRFGSWRSIVAFCDAGMETIHTWGRGATPYETMYSRAHFIASHFLAAMYKMRCPSVYWEAEVSDPLSRNALGEFRNSRIGSDSLSAQVAAAIVAAGGTIPETDNVYVWGEYLTLALADEVHFMNAGQRDYVLGLYPDDDPVIVRAAEVSRISPHPTPPADLYHAVNSSYQLDDDLVNIGYFGNFYKSQDPTAVLRACADLHRGGSRNVRLHMFVGDADGLSDAVQEAGAEAVVTCQDRVPYLEFLNLSRRMDLLLAIDARTQTGQERNPVLLSKWSDYRGSGTPVWGIVEEGSELSRQGLAHRSPLGHRTATLQVLTTLSRHQGHPQHR